MAEKVKLAFIGCGGMARFHLKGLKDLKEEGNELFSIEAVCDVEEQRAKSFSKEVSGLFGNQPLVYTDPEELLKRKDIEAVSICTTHITHYPLAKEAIKAGKHIMIEKPLAITLSEGRKIVELVERSGLVFAVAENYRRIPLNRAIKRMLEEKLIGEIYFFLYQWAGVGDKIFCGTPWRHRRSESGGGCMFDNGVHDSDLMQYWFGEVDEVYGTIKTYIPIREEKSLRVEATNEDFGAAIISFKSGVSGSWMGSWAANKGFHFVEIVGSRGTYYGERGVELKSGQVISKEELVKKYASDVRENSVASEYEDFFRAIATGKGPETDALVGLKAMALSYALYESAELGKPVKFDDVLEGRIANFEKKVVAAIESRLS
ncbi:hypothetical protein DRJ00_00320 [Candidatus Aerophobetes bacterium]|uniref:Gfo/Idh/MocA family oxidoreductase n=1 Tax=Aerophobetes bacterium TaxID=2030807 RepID=A0A497E6J5_UNCAE|nr:MAG: hypothetical protein DRJ00_00320 [Candidatus Aerophobetes bacterium]